MKKTIGILGGGLAGLSLAYFLDKDKFQLTILEKEAKCGGLLRAFEHQGFHFEFGGHILFSKDKEILNLILEFLGDNKAELYRNNKIYYQGRYIKYPFENNLSALPMAEAIDCLFSYLVNKLKYKKSPKNFGEFLYYHFGRAITEKYLWPYNQKIWNVTPSVMSVDWAKERLPLPPALDVVKSALGISTEGYKHQLYFYYPRQGGIQALPDSVLKKDLQAGVEVVNDFEINKIDKIQKGYLVSGSGQEKFFDEIVIALPIHNFFQCWQGTPPAVNRALSKLSYNSLITVMLGIKRDQLTDKFAVYFSDPSLLFHRVCFNKYLSESMCPVGTSLVQAEITANPGDGVYELTDEAVTQRVIEGLSREKVINSSEVIATKVIRTKYAYMVPQLDYNDNKKVIYDYSASQDLKACGRFAEFEYFNMDGVLKSARNLAAIFNQ